MESEPIKVAALGCPEQDVTVGGNGGDEFSFKCISSLISEISISYSKGRLNTIQLIFNTGQMVKVGNAAGSNQQKFVFSRSDKIVDLTLWPNIDHTRCAGLEFVVLKINGEKKTLSVTSDGMGAPVNVDVKSGRCYGIMGRSGDEIDALGFCFI